MASVVAKTSGPIQWWEWTVFAALVAVALVVVAVAWWRGWFDEEMVEDAIASRNGADNLGVPYWSGHGG